MKPSRKFNLDSLTASYRDLAARGLISPELAFLAGQVAYLGFEGKDDKALAFCCVMSRYLAEIEAGADFEWAFAQVTGQEAQAKLRLVK